MTVKIYNCVISSNLYSCHTWSLLIWHRQPKQSPLLSFSGWLIFYSFVVPNILIQFSSEHDINPIQKRNPSHAKMMSCQAKYVHRYFYCHECLVQKSQRTCSQQGNWKPPLLARVWRPRRSVGCYRAGTSAAMRPAVSTYRLYNISILKTCTYINTERKKYIANDAVIQWQYDKVKCSISSYPWLF